MRRIHFFTLVELLVVIAIIGILAGLLFPSLGSARSSARKTQCLNVKRNLGQAVNSYALNNDKLILVDGYSSAPYSWTLSGHSMGQSPSETDSQKRLPEEKVYLGFNAMRCPLSHISADADNPEEKVAGIFDTGSSGASGNTGWWGKSANKSKLSMTKRFGDFRIEGEHSTAYYSLRKLKGAAQLVLFADVFMAGSSGQSSIDDLYYKFNYDGNSSGTDVGKIGLIHSNETTVGYADGHASGEKKESLRDGACALDNFLDANLQPIK